jgi:hypothetical protein
MSEQEFFDLAIQVIASRATPEETEALDAELARHPARKAELERLRQVSAIAGETVQLAEIMENPAPAEPPGYARRRLQESLKKTFPTPTTSPAMWKRFIQPIHPWRWALGAAATAVAIALFVSMNSSHRPDSTLVVKGSVGQTRDTTFSTSNDVKLTVNRPESPVIQLSKLGSARQTNGGATVSDQNNVKLAVNHPKPPVILLAMLDSVGQTRGVTGSGPTDTELATTLKQSLGQTNLMVFSETADLKQWLDQWPDDQNLTVIKIWYDRDASEIRVQSRTNNIMQFKESFGVERESDLPSVINHVRRDLLP